MYVSIDDEKHEITGNAIDGVIKTLYLLAVQFYNEQAQTKQLAAKMFARKMLQEMENKAPNLRDVLRPKRGDDPVLHMARIWAGLLKQAVMESHATVQITTTEQGRASGIEAIIFQPESSSQSGGQLVDLGEKRKRKNNLRKDAPHPTLPPVS